MDFNKTKICPKCDFPRHPKDLECPNCGVIYKKAEQAICNHADNDDANSETVCYMCPLCNRSIHKNETECPLCGYADKCWGCNRLAELNVEVCPHCQFKIIKSEEKKGITFWIVLIVGYFILSFLFLIKRPYTISFNQEYLFTIKVLSLPIILISFFVAHKACKVILPGTIYHFLLVFFGMTFAFLLTTSLYVAAINYYIGEHPAMEVSCQVVGKRIVGWQGTSRVIQISSPQLPSTLSFRVTKLYYETVKTGDQFKKRIKKGSLGLYYWDRKE